MSLFESFSSTVTEEIARMILFFLILVVIDFVSGIINALFKKEFKSGVMRNGLMNKSRELLTVVLGILFDAMGAGFMPCKILPAILVYLIFMEAASIIENCDLLLPESIRIIFKKGADKNDKG